MKIDLFNRAADEVKITRAIQDGTFKIVSPLYVKYIAKNITEGLIIGTVVGLTVVGALATIATFLPSEDEETE